MLRLIRSLVTLVVITAAWTALVLVWGAQPNGTASITAPIGLAPTKALAAAPQAPVAAAAQPACLTDRGTDCVPPATVTSECPGNAGDGPAGCPGTGGAAPLAADGAGTAPQALPVATDEVFVRDSGPWLDWYTSGDASGLMTITLPVPRVFSTWMSPTLSPPLLDANGFLNTGVSLTQLISHSVLPPTATLKLAVYDVDDTAGQP